MLPAVRTAAAAFKVQGAVAAPTCNMRFQMSYKVDLIIDGGYGDNQPSTIIDLSEGEPVVIREGKGDSNIF